MVNIKIKTLALEFTLPLLMIDSDMSGYIPRLSSFSHSNYVETLSSIDITDGENYPTLEWCLMELDALLDSAVAVSNRDSFDPVFFTNCWQFTQECHCEPVRLSLANIIA